MKLSHPRCIDTTLSHHPAFEAVTCMAYTQAALPRYRIGGFGQTGTIPKRARLYRSSQTTLRAVRSGLSCSSCDQVDNFAGLRPGTENS